ncbi:hypothetical protein CK203_014589 [Vitis vinifera]|uniref:Uncharacterized protein n=1 Tax=Vitis vinifera TaxID=29760 RepID=A0A438K4S4_VITVI|nr:hypothetical protein CK203_014589 [Vitis vinifera]
MDRGGEYYGRYTKDGQHPFVKFLQEHGIVAQYTMLVPHTRMVVPRRHLNYGNVGNRVCDIYTFGMPVRSKSLQPTREKLDPRTISVYFIGYVKSGSDRFQDIVSEKYHIDAQPSTSSDRLIIIHNAPQVKQDISQWKSEEEVYMKQPEGFSSMVVSICLMYAQVYTRPDIAFAIGMLGRYRVIQPVELFLGEAQTNFDCNFRYEG